MSEVEIRALSLRQGWILASGGGVLLAGLWAVDAAAASLVPGGGGVLGALLVTAVALALHQLLRRSVLLPVLAAARADHDRLAASEARFAAAASAIPDGLAIFDAQRRLVYHNSHYPDLLAEPYRETLALGQTIERWVERASALGPIYHAEMGTDFLEHRLALRMLPAADHEHRLADGRWMRVRERQMQDGGRVLLVTDVTAARAQEAALKASGERFRSIVDDQVEFISRLDRDLTFTFVNEAYANQLGRPRDALVGTSLLDLMRPDQQEQFKAQLAALTPERPTVAYEMEGSRADGTPTIEAWVDRALFDREGTLLEYQSVGRDVTDERHAAAALRRSEARFRAIAESVPVAVVIAAADRPAILFANNRARNLLGLGEPGDDSDPVRVWEDPRARAEVVRRVLAEGVVEGVEARLVRRDGTPMTALVSARLTDHEGERAILSAIADISALRATEEALRASEARLAAFMNHAPVGVHIKDVEGRYLMANPEMAKVFRRPPEEVIGLTPFDLFPAEEASMIDRHHRAVVESGHGIMVEEYQPSLEEYRWTSMFRFPIRDPAGRVTGVGGFAVDITAQKQAQAELEASEARFRAIAESVPMPVVISAVSRGAILFANRRARSVFDLGSPDAEVDHGRIWVDIAAREEIARRVVAEGFVEGVEVRLKRACGTPFDAMLSVRLIDYAGEPAAVGAIADISELRRAEEALRASEAKLAAFLAHAPVAMCLEDLEGRYQLLNPEMRKILGRSPEEAIGRTPFDLFPADEAAMVARNCRAVLESGQPIVFEEHQPSLEAYQWSQVIRFPIKDATGRITGAGGFALDITPQKRAQAELAASEARFRMIAELHPIPLAITRLADRAVLFVNQAFCETFKIDRDCFACDFDRTELYDDPAVREEIFTTIAAGRSFENRELVMRDSAGRRFPVIYDARPMLYDGHTCIVTSVRDVSELKAAEAEIRRQREALHQTEKLSALGTLLAGVAHELNNPLSVVVGHASLLKDMAADSGTRQRAERIHTAAERCARIVKTFLAMARQKPPSWGVVRAGAVVEAALELAGYQLRSAGVAIQRDLPEDLPPVWGDSDQLHQVLTNLVVNAQQALLQVAPPRRLTLAARRLGQSEVVVSVEDNGPGIPAELRQRIFDPFFTTKPQGVGTGIGLSVCHAIVTAHQGRILVEDGTDGGTRVSVVLPVAGTRAAAAVAADEPGSGPLRARVLVVDDEAEIADLIAEVLRRDGYGVETAASGRAALERLARRGADVLVTDLRMPELDGLALLREIKARHPDLARRVVIVTGDALSAEVAGLARDTGVSVLEKPLDMDALRGRLQAVLAAG